MNLASPWCCLRRIATDVQLIEVSRQRGLKRGDVNETLMTVVLKTLSLYLLLHLTLIKYVHIVSEIFISIYYILMENIFLFTDTLYLKNTTET